MEPPHDKNSEELREHFDHNGHGDIEQGLTSKKGRTKSQPDQPASSDGVQKTLRIDGFLGTNDLRKYGIRAKTFFRLLDHQLWIFKDDKAPHAVTYINLKKAIDIVPSGGPNLKLNMKDGRHYTFKAHTQEDFKKWGAAISQGIKNANSPVPEKKEVDVSFMDRSSLPIVIDPKKTTAEDLWWMVCEALNLSQDCPLPVDDNSSRTGRCISEVLLCNDDLVYDVLQRWHKTEKKYDEKLAGPPRLVFKTTPMLELKQERNTKDNKAVHLFYVQALFNLLAGNYIIDSNLAVELSGMAAQVRFGDYNPNKHQPGYIANVLGRLLPPYIQKRISKKPEVWEQIVHTEHKKHTGKPLMIVELLFLQPLRGLPYYGCTFFSVINRDRSQSSGFFQQKDQGSINLGINMDGVHIIVGDTYMNSFSWKDITHWEVEQDRYFYLATSILDSGGFFNQYLVESRQAPLIRELISDIIFELKRTKRLIHTIRKKQSQFIGSVLAGGGKGIGSNIGTGMTEAIKRGDGTGDDLRLNIVPEAPKALFNPSPRTHPDAAAPTHNQPPSRRRQPEEQHEDSHEQQTPREQEHSLPSSSASASALDDSSDSSSSSESS